MARGGRHDDAAMVDVLLTEEPDEPHDAATRARSDGPEAHDALRRDVRRNRRRRRAVAVAVLAVLVAGAVGTAVEDARDRAHRAALAAVPGVLPPFDGRPEVVWEAAGSVRGMVGDVLLLATGSGLRGVDAASGDELWTRTPPLSGGGEEWCRPVGAAAQQEVESPTTRTVQAGGAQPVLLACTVYALGYADQADFGPVLVTVLDSRTGEVRQTLAGSGALLTAEPLEADLLVVTARPDGHVHVIRWDPLTGLRRWETTSADPVLAPGTAAVSDWRESADVLRITGVTSTAFSLGTGREVPAGQQDEPVHRAVEVPLPDGGSAVWRYDGFADGGSGEVTDATGAVLFDIPAPPWTPPVDDGSAPGVLLVHGSGLGSEVVGLDARTGTELWRAPIGWSAALLRLDGQGVVAVGSLLTAFDLATGEVRWTARLAAPSGPQALTDGDVVVVLGPAPHDVRGGRRLGTDLVALDLEDGAERWRVPVPALPPGVGDGAGPRITPGPDGVLLVETGQGVVALR